MAKQASSPPEDKIELFEKLLDTHPDIERKGVTMPYTSVNGHMFSHLDKSGTLGLRLPPEQHEAFFAKYDSGPYIQYGSVMKEYVTIPDELLQNTAELAPYLAISYDYVKSLKPKPTRKKK